MQKGKRFALLIIVNFIWMFLVYQGCIQIGDKIGSALPYKICTIVYGAAAILLFLIYWIKSHPKTEGAETAAGAGKLLLAWAFPILIIFLLDLFDLYVLQQVRELLASIRDL